LYDCVPSRGALETLSDFIGRSFRATPTTRISHLALKDLQFWRDLPQKLHHRPIWPKEHTSTDTAHTDASMSVCGATLSHGEHEAETRGFYGYRGYWEGSHKELAHITVLELTDEIGFEGVFGILCSARERGGQVVHRQHVGHVRREPVGVEIAGYHGRATDAAPVLQATRSNVGFASPSVGTGPFRRQTVEGEESG
jgi:hypothetical protein